MIKKYLKYLFTGATLVKFIMLLAFGILMFLQKEEVILVRLIGFFILAIFISGTYYDFKKVKHKHF